MSDSDNSDLALSVYDPEDNLNFYGSPVHGERSSPVHGEGSSSAGATAATTSCEYLAQTPQRTQFCSCKNTCSKRSGKKKRGCPCRDENLKCAENCSCGTMKAGCKNKSTSSNLETATTHAGKSAFERHNAAVEEAKQQIMEFIGKLTEPQKDNILLNLLSNGKGSLDYAKNLVSFSNGGSSVPPVRNGKPTWCTCGVCRPMVTEEENKCCGKICCITSFVTFHNTCIDREVLVLAVRARCDIRVEDPDYSTNSYRKAAYRQYILWRYKKLGTGNRRVCPSCVVLAIRHIYPADDGNYMGFRRA